MVKFSSFLSKIKVMNKGFSVLAEKYPYLIFTIPIPVTVFFYDLVGQQLADGISVSIVLGLATYFILNAFVKNK